MSPLETVTVLFTDLVGSTGLATRVGPAAAEGLRREHFAVLREAVASTGGREVKNVGDGLMVVFQSCSAAVACGVEMQQRLELRNRRAEEQLAVRVGISMGETDVEEDDYFGAPVVEAARLCDAAAGGQILCGDVVRMMAREGHGFRPIGALELKGLPDTPAHEVEWSATAVTAVPLPTRLREVPPVRYVGRREEREALAFLFDQAREGSRRIAFVSGEPGIGKTRLSTQLAVEAHGDGATVLYGRCDEELGVPYGPWVSALRHYVAEASEDILRAHARQHGGELARLVPEVRSRLGEYPEPRQTDPESERYLLFGAVAGLFEEATRETPLVLILDDLHWADAPSLSLLRYVATHDGPMRVLVLGTYRDSELARGHPLASLLADLHREEGVTRIPLTGLEEPNVIALMEAAAGHELDDTGRSLAQAILRETDGNPFYVAEILRHLVEIGAVVRAADGRFRVHGELDELALPQSVREVVGRRVERLSEPSRRALGVAAVIGRDFDVDLLARVVEEDETVLLDLLEEATAASVVDESSAPVGRFTFAHALINHTLYEDLGPTRRARLHARIAEELEEICGEDPGARVAELAHHWGRAATADRPSKATEYARRAGERALEKLAPDEALRWFKQAMELGGDLDDPAVRCDLLIGLGDASRQLGDASHRETLLEAGKLASELRDADRAARAALANHRGINSVFGVVDEERVAALERAVELDGLRNKARSARLISRRAVELQHDPDHERRWRLADEALTLARESGDERTLANVLFEYRYATAARYDMRVMRRLEDELMELVERLDDPALRVWVGMLEIGQCTAEGDLAAAEAELARVTPLAGELGQPVLLWFAAYLESTLRYMQGDLPAAERIAEEAFQIGAQGAQPDAPMIYGAQTCVMLTAYDRVEEIIGLVEQGVEANPGLPAWRAFLASTYALVGETDKAADLLTSSAKNDFREVFHDQIYVSTMVRYADAAFETQHRDAAAFLYQVLEPWAEVVTWDGASSQGQVRMYLGMLAATLGQDERAEEHLRSACEFADRAGMPMFVAYGRLRWAEALARRGDAEAARAQATLARETAQEVGYLLIENRATALLEMAASTGKHPH